ncbi:MAG TPA: YigZ family protein [Longimicrobiales bacterium]|nr:YigZ family protein [Longimicrobiales bacterium]
MTVPARYPVPAARYRVEEEVRRSRFLTTVGRAATREEAEVFIAAIRAEFPDATHNCWAFVAGPPGSTAVVGMSDDGEPHGTAGRPILETLLHSGVGEIAAVVTRWFGGVKLGKGGLGRAYAGAVAHALASMPRAERVERSRLRVVCDYPARDPLLRLAADVDAAVEAEEYGIHVTLVFAVPVPEVARFRDGVAALTAGGARVEDAGAPDSDGERAEERAEERLED